MTARDVERDLNDGMAALPDAARQLGVSVSGPRSVTWLGQRAREITISGPGVAPDGSAGAVCIRIAVTDTHMYVAGIAMETDRKLARFKSAYFDNIELLK